ncbi:MAG: hypothetical protein ABIU58_11440 [Ramlibacter sp.]
MKWRELTFPELKKFPEVEREAALGKARASAFDSIENVGIFLSLVVVTTLVGKMEIPAAASDRFLSTLFSFVIAIPLLALTAGAFMVRRTRRGLRKQLGQHRS